MASTVAFDNATSSDSVRELPEYTRAEVKKHNSADDIWVIISNEVYDLTSWIDKHPGGSPILAVQAGYDVTTPFIVNHSPEICKRANAFKIGVLKKAEHEEFSGLTNDLLALREDLRKKGWYKTDFWYLKCKIVFNLTCLICAWYFVAKCKALVLQVLGALFMALYLQQMAFIGHDLGHAAVTNDRYLDYLLGSFCICLLGLSCSWWKINHQTHHVVTNSVEHDPDIQHLPFVSMNREQLEKAYWSKFYQRWFEFDRIAKFLVKYQHWTIFLIYSVSPFYLYGRGLQTLLTVKNVPLLNRSLELVGWCVYCWWQFMFYKSAGSFQRSLIVFVIAKAVFGLVISVQIGISHWISPVVHFHPDPKNWFRHQLATTIDIDCYSINDWFHGGLQFQVAHHLFPALPRCYLRRARVLIKKVLKKHNVKYPEMSFYDMLVTMWNHFAAVAEEASKLPTACAPKNKLY